MTLALVDSRLPDTLAGINYSTGRGSNPYGIDAAVIHVTEGDRDSVRSWFDDPNAGVSAHYMNRTDGVVEQFVDEADKAYHAGQLVNPTAALVLARRPYSPNSWAIGIENEGDGTRELTGPQRDSLYELLLDINARRPAMTFDRTHIIGHHEVKASKTCPGAISVDRIVSDLVSLSGQRAHAPHLALSPSLGALIVAGVESDDVWNFVTLAHVQQMIAAGQIPTMRAGTALSNLRAYAPIDPA